MNHRNSVKKDRPLEFPPLPLWAEGNIGFFDPMGSYTGNSLCPEEKDVQDMDDL